MFALSAPIAVLARAVPAQVAKHASGTASRRGFKVGLGAVLTTHFGGQIFNFDVNQSGTDGILTEGPSFGSAVESFDSTTGKVTKVLKKVHSPSADDQLVTYGIFANDLAFVDLLRETHTNGRIGRDDEYFTATPLTGGKLNGRWKNPREQNSILQWVAANQQTSTQAMLLYQESASPSDPTIPWLYATDFATGKTKSFGLGAYFGIQDVPHIAQDTVTNQAVFALSSDAGRAGGSPPLNILVNLATGAETSFNGLNNGGYGSGDVDGLAVDSTTGIACTTTQLNSQVEFYNLASETSAWAQLPGTTSETEYNAALTVTNDPANGLFLVAQPISSSTPSGSTIYVYNESGSLIETLNGFNFADADNQVYGYPGLHLVPTARMGYVNGPALNQLQQFFY